MACARGGQDIYRLLGQDPIDEPLSSLEFSVFAALVKEIEDAYANQQIYSLFGSGD